MEPDSVETVAFYILGELTLSLKQLYTNLLHHLLNEPNAHWHWMKPRWKLHCLSGPTSWKLIFILHSDPKRGAEEAWYSHLNLCKVRISGFQPHLQPPPTSLNQKDLLVWTWRSGASVKLECTGRESGVGLSLAQPLSLAQGLLCCSKAPEHASETPSFTAWLAEPHTQPNQMLLNLAHQITGEHVSHPTAKWFLRLYFLCLMLIWSYFFTGKEKWTSFQILGSYSRFMERVFPKFEAKSFDAIKKQIVLAGQQTDSGRPPLWFTELYPEGS